MKKERYRALFALLLVATLSACSNENYLSPETSQPGSVIELSVSARDFLTDGASHTRAADNGNVTTFQVGDRIGLIIVENDGTDLVANNVPYKYDGANWTFDAGNGEGKTAAYYDNGIGNVTYIAYFPYSKEANDVKTLDDLKGKFTPKPDQRSEADYRASDLMVWAPVTASTPQKSLTIALTHAYASISLSPEVKCTLDDGNSTEVSLSSSRLSDINFTIGSDVYLPFQAEDGSFRCILPASTSGSVRWFYTLGNKSFGGSKDFSSGVAANTRYVQNETLKAGSYTLDLAQTGDFYCKKADGSEGYLIPGDIATLTSEQKAACIGIVFYVGRHSTDDSDYMASGIGSSAIQGYVVALKNAGSSLKWEYGPNNESDRRVDASTNSGDWKGYFNQTKIEEYAGNTAGWAMTHFPAAKVCADWGENNTSPNSTAYKAPTGSSGWFLPSAGQLSGGLYNNRTVIESALTKAGGEGFGNSDYWSSTE